MNARDVMTRQLVTVTLDASLVECAHKLLDWGFRQLPVVDAVGRFQGVITDAQLFRTGMIGQDQRWHPFEFPPGRDVLDLLEPCPTVHVDEPVLRLLARMLESELPVVVVVRDATPVGIITEHDAMGFAARWMSSQRWVDDESSSPLKTVDAAKEAGEAWDEMIGLGIRHLVVVEHGRIAGVVSRHDMAHGYRGPGVFRTVGDVEHPQRRGLPHGYRDPQGHSARADDQSGACCREVDGPGARQSAWDHGRRIGPPRIS